MGGGSQGRVFPVLPTLPSRRRLTLRSPAGFEAARRTEFPLEGAAHRTDGEYVILERMCGGI